MLALRIGTVKNSKKSVDLENSPHLRSVLLDSYQTQSFFQYPDLILYSANLSRSRSMDKAPLSFSNNASGSLSLSWLTSSGVKLLLRGSRGAVGSLEFGHFENVVPEEIKLFPYATITEPASSVARSGQKSIAQGLPWVSQENVFSPEGARDVRMRTGPVGSRSFPHLTAPSLRARLLPSVANVQTAERRDAALAERLFWSVLDHLQKLSPGLPPDVEAKDYYSSAFSSHHSCGGL